MEQEAKMLLFKRLDECIKEHTTAMFFDNAQPDMKDIYELQQLAEIHYHLKAEHPFTPAEVEALLTFRDPLNVARWCWEENTHPHSFPICELLQTINAYGRFEQSPQIPSLKEKEVELTKLLGQNYYSYMEEIRSLSVSAVIDRCHEISATMNAYKYMVEDYELTREAADYLLRFDNPLELIRSYWPDSYIEGEIVMQMVLDDMRTPPEERQEQPKSLRERLQNAAREVKDRPAAEKPGRDSGAR